MNSFIKMLIFKNIFELSIHKLYIPLVFAKHSLLCSFIHKIESSVGETLQGVAKKSVSESLKSTENTTHNGRNRITINFQYI